MLRWFIELFRELRFILSRFLELFINGSKVLRSSRKSFKWPLITGLVILTLVLISTAFMRPQFFTPFFTDRPLLSFAPAGPDYTKPVRDEPGSFPRNTRMPGLREGKASGSIGKIPFDPEQDLIRIEDGRVWWESEHDHNDSEDDHLFHLAMEDPMRRLIELVDQVNGQLKVQDAYRDKGVHSRTSLHKQGRAVDLTANVISLEKLAQLCWAAGFDWVYYEAPKKGGHHIHCSVRPHE